MRQRMMRCNYRQARMVDVQILQFYLILSKAFEAEIFHFTSSIEDVNAALFIFSFSIQCVHDSDKP